MYLLFFRFYLHIGFSRGWSDGQVFPSLSEFSTVYCDPHTQRTSLMAQRVKCLSAMQETRVQSLGGEDPLEKGMATHSSTLVCRIPWTEEPGVLTVHMVTKSQT